MRKLIFSAAVVVAAMTSCAKSETGVADKHSYPIGFTNGVISRVNAVTDSKWNVVAVKGTAGSIDYLAASEEFRDVYNYKTSGRNDCTYDDSQASPKYRYYDGVNTYRFICWGKNVLGGYEIADLTSAEAAYTAHISDPTIAFTVPAAANLDLVKAKTEDVTLTDQSAANNEVQLRFYHTLSKVRFTFRTTTYTLDQPIKVTGLSFTVNSKSGNLGVAEAGSGTWSSVAGGAATYTIPVGSWINAALDDSATYKEMTTPAGTVSTSTFYVMPQQLVNTTDEILLSYTVGGVPATKHLPLSMLLEADHSYNFQITINLNRIDFTALVEDWVGEGEFTL